MGNTDSVHYQPLEADTFEDVDLEEKRNYDCVMVFDIGSDTKDWKAPADGAAINFEYLSHLDTADLEKRKQSFPQHGADFSSSRTKEKDFYRSERKLVIKALTKMNVKVKHISAMTKEFEQDKGLKFYYIGIQEGTARKFADKLEYELEIEPEAAITYLSLMNEALASATVSDTIDCKSVLEKHWHNVFIKYDDNVAPEIYKPHDVLDEGDEKAGYEDSLFKIRDRLALIYEMVVQDYQLGGCGIFVPTLKQKDHPICDFYPLHTLEHLEVIMDNLFSWYSLTIGILTLPLEEIRTYFGEYIGIYFAYLEFMTIYFVPITIIGLIIQILQWGEDTILIDGIWIFALITIGWSIFFPILWRWKEFKWALKWGTLRFDFKERPRPEFEGVYRKSDITGSKEEYFPESLRNTRRIVTLSVVIAFLIALFGSIVLVVLLRVYVAETDIDYGSYYISIANALVIMFFNNIYGIFAEKLNEWENYKTETEYENNLIIKIFIFRFINSYASLYYIAFFRRWDSDPSIYCSAEDCMDDLSEQLATIFITQLTVSNAIELGSLVIGRLFSGGAVTSYFTKDEKECIWNQYSSEVYERTFDDYCELVVSFGYATLFVISFPLAPFCAFVGCVVEARIDGYKLCKLTRRPFPRQADDVGTWQLAMEVMGWAVLITNLAMICFTSEELDFTFLNLSDSYFEETLTALLLFAITFVLVVVLNYCVAGVPRKISKHMARQDHIEHSVKKIGDGIERYLDSLTADEITTWQFWTPQKVAKYLQKTVYENPQEFRTLEAEIIHSRFNGKQFQNAGVHEIEKRLQITDNLQQRFILNARRILIQQAEHIREDNQLIDDVENSVDQRGQSISGGNDTRRVFNFTNDNLITMAEFFEEDLTGQSKRKLWTKVDKDMSSIIEKNEMEAFLYFSIVVYIKAKYQNVKLPKKNDRKFQTKVLKPLERWLLHYKVSAVGLTFDEFDRFFPSWLREYYREMKASSHGGQSQYQTIRMGQMGQSQDNDSDNHLQSKIASNKKKKNKLGNLLGGMDIFANKNKNQQSTTTTTTELTGQNNINRDGWSDSSLEWEKKLDLVAVAIEKTDHNTRKKIWDKFDRNKKGILDTDKSLARLIYSLIALYIKTQDRSAKPPKYNSLSDLLHSICVDIRSNMMNVKNAKQITKNDFQNNIHIYLKKVAKQRRESLYL